MENEIFVENLETSIVRVINAITAEGAITSVKTEVQIDRLVEHLKKLEPKEISFKELEDQLSKILTELSKEPPAVEDTSTPEIVLAIKSLQKSIDDIEPAEFDTTSLESRLDQVIQKIGEIVIPPVVFPKEYPLPAEQVKILTPFSNIELLSSVEEVVAELKKIQETGFGGGGGGGADVVGLKDSTGLVQINPATSDNQTDGSQKTQFVGNEYVDGNSGIDSVSEAAVVIDYSHHEIHNGSHYKAGFGSITQVLDIDDTVTLLFVTPDTGKWGHWTLTAQATAFAKVEIFEEAVTTSNGTPVTRWNRNRNSDNESEILVYHTPTVTSNGSKFSSKFIGGTGFKSDIGGSTRGSSEVMLKQNTKYLVIGTALADNMSLQIGGDWYEHTNKN